MARRFVQFPHPKDEAGLDRQQWLRADTAHRRSFVVAEAMFRTSIDGPDEHGLVTAWVEWEAASECRRRPTGGPIGSPEYVHRPISPAIAPPMERIPQNTDPLVFGGRFLTTFCRQTERDRARAGLLELDRGSVIVFGSRPNYQWVCDTVLVVGDTVRHDIRTYEDRLAGRVSELALLATLGPMYAWRPTVPFNALFGATPADAIEGMFSFVPCLPAEDGLRGFVRPSLNGHSAINPNSFRSASFNREIEPADFPTLWRAVANTVLEEGLALATNLRLPPETVFDELPIL